ncbi:MAG: DNA-binding response regulator [Clostridiales bacterium]|nr:MAG: DNA-binding response regulator [Clostridiales bacterium]
MKKLLFIDDDTDFLKSNRLYFERKNYEVFCLNKPNDAIPFLSSTAIDCIVLDIDMPDMTGFEVCQKIRDISGTPIIFLSGLADIKNRISSFQAGGDDFLAKPYDIIELELRIEARIRKNEQVFFSDIMRFGDLCIDENRRMITYKESPGEFSALQFDIIAFMARNPGKVFSYEQIYDRIWKEPIFKSRHNLQVAVATVRQKLARLCDGRQYIRTLARKGYYFTPDETREDKTN